ncbi:DUF6461 domain-containing protein [Embleya hyalina]|uniref:Uncharacterized protein n=1 Tax=Embleya hyalina TaxID=516124 RepID=A0A401YYD2_9ACTN|nr:DUF6461 domain-containing protein [Embleya hyalina]GCD99629.1 hypothetical protein EHYA_07351 [Embleya hyalina]
MTLSGVRWLAGTEALDPDYCVTFARGFSPMELLASMGCAVDEASPMTSDDAADFMSQQYDDDNLRIMIRAGMAGDWAFAIEDGSIYGQRPEIMKGVAANTEAICLYRTIRGISGFGYARESDIICAFMAKYPLSASGSDPARLESALQRVGLGFGGNGPFPSESPWEDILRMAEEEFSLALPLPDIFTAGLLAAPVMYE